MKVKILIIIVLLLNVVTLSSINVFGQTKPLTAEDVKQQLERNTKQNRPTFVYVWASGYAKEI
jgi:tRNA A37 threonylcarbamoyladenosine synthetase subunit TsaC/SUA5/YrdC